MATGLHVDEATSDADGPGGGSGGDPLAAIRAINALGSEDGAALLVLVNFHRFLGSAEIVQAPAQQISAGKQNRTYIVILSPVVQIPVEFEKLFAVIEHELPGAEIKACCRHAALLDLPLVAAAHNVVPVAVTAAESVVEKLRGWASGRCLSADKTGLYRRDQAGNAGGKARRQVRVNPADN